VDYADAGKKNVERAIDGIIPIAGLIASFFAELTRSPHNGRREEVNSPVEMLLKAPSKPQKNFFIKGLMKLVAGWIEFHGISCAQCARTLAPPFGLRAINNRAFFKTPSIDVFLLTWP